ncbi:MAG: hypothetical protein HYV23_05210 [Deltaproteobacteria bacterium]|nr:hypothetical protein [Deltaproteobacteria bacterium]
MRIEDNHIQQASRHHVEGHGKKEGLDSVKERRDHGHHHDEKAVHHGKRPDSVAISDEARARFESMHKKSSEARGRQFDIPAGLDNAGFLGRLVHGAFAGHEINITDAVRAGAPAASQTEGAPALSGTTAGFTASVEQLSFSASGTIKTADGEEVGFTLELNMTKASMSGFSSSVSGDGQSPMTVNYAGSSSELFSMSFKFNISSEEETGVQDGSGLLAIDRDEETSGETGEEDHISELEEDGETATPALSVPDFFKALRKADFTSTYLSFSKTTIEASSYLAVAEGAPFDGFMPPASSPGAAPVDLIA